MSNICVILSQYFLSISSVFYREESCTGPGEQPHAGKVHCAQPRSQVPGPRPPATVQGRGLPAHPCSAFLNNRQSLGRLSNPGAPAAPPSPGTVSGPPVLFRVSQRCKERRHSDGPAGRQGLEEHPGQVGGNPGFLLPQLFPTKGEDPRSLVFFTRSREGR